MDTRATIIVPQNQISAVQATSDDASRMFNSFVKDSDGNIFGIANGGIYNTTLNAISAAQIPGVIFRFPDGQFDGFTPFESEDLN